MPTNLAFQQDKAQQKSEMYVDFDSSRYNRRSSVPMTVTSLIHRFASNDNDVGKINIHEKA